MIHKIQNLANNLNFSVKSGHIMETKFDLNKIRKIRLVKNKDTGLFYSPDLSTAELKSLDEEWR